MTTDADGPAPGTAAPSGAGATSDADLSTEMRAAKEAGDYAAAVAGVDADAAAPIPRDATEQLADPNAASSAPAEAAPRELRADDFSRE
jgi:hypothetical protein